MGIFTCCECDGYKDSDYGCEECNEHHLGLICDQCLEDRPDPVDIEEVHSGY